jgi:hypothetical protein
MAFRRQRPGAQRVTAQWFLAVGVLVLAAPRAGDRFLLTPSTHTEEMP